MLKLIKRSLLAAGKSMGVFTLISRSGWRSRRLVILCYHGISTNDEHRWNPSLFVDAARFRQRLEALKKNRYNVLPLGEALDLLRDGGLPQRSVAITFDDGFYNFYTQASPMLQEFGFPSTVYLTTYYCDDNRPVFDLVCSYLLWKGQAATPADLTGLSTQKGSVNLGSIEARKQALSSIFHFAEMEQLTAEDRDCLAARLAARLSLDYEAIRSSRLLHLMNPAEVKDLSERGFSFELHTHRHRTPQDETLFGEEICTNRLRIAEITGLEPAHFCYPSGVHKREFLPWLKAQNVISGTTCDPGLASRTTDPLLLPRVLDHSHFTSAEFESWLCGLGSLLPVS